MDSSTGSISIINAGPPGPPGSAGTDQHIIDVIAASLGEGSGIAIDSTSTPGVINIINTGAVTSYGDENVRDAVGSALQGTTDQIVVTPDDPGDIINLAVSPVLLGRVLALEQAKSLLQYKDSTASSGTKYMDLTGASGYVYANSSSAMNFTGDVTMVGRVQMPTTAPASSIVIGGRVGATIAQTQFRFTITTGGQMSVTFSVNGTSTNTLLTTATTPLAFDGNWIWVRFRRVASTGSADFYWAPDDGTNNFPATWNNFQTNRTSATGSFWTNAGALVEKFTVGTYNSGATSPFTGKMGRVALFNSLLVGTNGIVDANASDYVSGTTWTGPFSNTWNLSGTATVQGGGSNAISNTAAEFTLTETDANAGVTLVRGDALLWLAVGTFTNTSGSAQTFTPKLRINGVDLFTFAAISIPSTAAGQVYKWECALRVEVNAADGTKQIAQANFRILSATTGTDLGSSVMAGPLTGGDLGGIVSGTITTFSTVPNIQLKNTMQTAAATIASRPLLTQLALLAA